MNYWSREIGGWVLLLLGLTAFWLAYMFLLDKKKVLQAGPMMFIGFIVFRGGLHLLKVAAAAQAARAMWEPSPTPPRRGPTTRPIGPTPPRAILPGAGPAPGKAVP